MTFLQIDDGKLNCSSNVFSSSFNFENKKWIESLTDCCVCMGSKPLYLKKEYPFEKWILITWSYTLLDFVTYFNA